MREVRRVGSAKVVLYCPKDVEQALFANTPVSAAKAFANLSKITCKVRLCCGGSARTLGDTALNDAGASVKLNKANFKRIALATANPLRDKIPNYPGEFVGPVAVCPDAAHDIPMVDALWTATFLAASLRHDMAPRGQYS